MIERSFNGLSAVGFHRVSYTQWDPSQGAPMRAVVCVHGLTRNGRDFDRLAAALADALQARVVCPSVVGRGKSDWLANPDLYGYPQYLADMATLIARLDVDRVDWVGSSMGGLIGMMLAAQPNSPIRRLVVNDIGPFIPKAALERIRDYIGHDPSFPDVAALDTYLREIYAVWGPMTDADWAHMATHTARPHPSGGVGLAYDPGIAKAFKTQPLTDVDLWAVWNAIRCPVLAFRGALSDLMLADTAARMTVEGPRATLVTVDGVGHCPSLMDADGIGRVRDFFAQA